MLPTPPQIPSYPIVGNLPHLAGDRNAFFTEQYRKYGPMFTFKLGPQPVVVLIDPDLHKFFFTETDRVLNIEKPYKPLAATFGPTAFLASRDIYLNQQPVLTAPFRPEKMQAYAAIMQRVTQQWLDQLGASGEIDITGEMGYLVQDIAGYTLLGEKFQRAVGKEFWALYRDLGKAVNFVTPQDWPLPQNFRRDRAKQRMREILDPIVAERRRNPDQYDDFLQDFVNTRCRDGQPASDEALVSMIRGLMFASHETTAGQAAWTIIELARNPEYLRLVRNEVDAHLPFGSIVDGKSMRKLEHVFWAVREVERLHPSADMLLRVVDEEIELGGYRIPKDWMVSVMAYISHRNPAIFSNPDQFDPLRFAPDRAEDKAHGYTLIGFGGGKHKCAGMNFANNEMLIITALLVQQYDFELVTTDPKPHYGFGASRPVTTFLRYRRRAELN